MGAVTMAMTDTFEDCKEILERDVALHYRRYGGDLEELRSEANMQFVEAYVRYEPSRGDFLTWCSFRVKKELYERFVRRPTQKANRKLHQQNHDMDLHAEEDRDFWLMEFLDSLSPDAVVVAKLFLEGVPLDIRLHAMERAGKKNYTSRTLLCATREYLHDLGWSKRHANHVFDEIRSAL